MRMPKQIDVTVTKPQNKQGNLRNRKCPIGPIYMSRVHCNSTCVFFYSKINSHEVSLFVLQYLDYHMYYLARYIPINKMSHDS